MFGNAVDVASTLEGLAKEKGYQIVMSVDVSRYAGYLNDLGALLTVTVRGVHPPDAGYRGASRPRLTCPATSQE